MSLGFEIPQKKSLDLLSLGAIVNRLDPGIIPFRKATSFAVHVSGGEFNVAANLADCFKLDTGIATAGPVKMLLEDDAPGDGEPVRAKA